MRPFSAISFDLDDTLYDNRPYIIAAEQAQIQFLHTQFPKVKGWHTGKWRALKTHCINAQPELAHDATLARWQTLYQGLLLAGYDTSTAMQGADAGLQCFVEHRSNFTVSAEVIDILQKLGQYVPLIGITNGNVDSQRIGLSKVMKFVLNASVDARVKPYPDMFEYSYLQLGIPPKQLLHVGDSYAADVQGARLNGAQVAWLNPAVGRTRQPYGQGCLPQVVIEDIAELIQLCEGFAVR